MIKSALKEVIRAKIPEARQKLLDLKKAKGTKVMSQSTVAQILGGMRGITALYTDISSLDPNEGIRFRGYSIPEINQRLPKIHNEVIPEALLWLLMSGDIPTKQQTMELSQELRQRENLSQNTLTILRTLPKNMHPMTQLSIGVLSLQMESEFLKAYNQGVHKTKLWENAYEDGLTLIAKIPKIASFIYCKSYLDKEPAAAPKDLDWSANFCREIYFNNEQFDELMRLYFWIHADHEVGNVSAHTTHLVGSALSDPFLSFSAGLNGLAGPLHGLANQEVLKFLLKMKEKLGDDISDEKIEEFCWAILKSGQVIPGYGHGVLRVTDPRFTVQMDFAERYIANDPMFKLVKQNYKVIPRVLDQTGKIKNPWPNVDAHSGVLLRNYGLTQFDFYTVLFGVSRALGTMSNLVWSRAYGFPIERPASISMKSLE